MKTTILLLTAILACTIHPTIAQSKSEVLTNKSVIDLCKAGLNAATVISKIESSNTKFDVSTTGLINLKTQKVPDDVIDAIVKKADKGSPSSATPPSPTGIKSPTPSAMGSSPDLEFVNVIHYYNKVSKSLMVLERSTVAVKAKVNFLKAMVPGTSIPIVFKLKGDKSPAKVPTREAISFMVNSGIYTPEIFGLYRMQVKKGQREATWFNVSAFENKSDKDVIAFNYRKIKEGVYEIVPISRLEGGEYCFVNKNSYSTYGGSKADVFAFEVE